MRICDLHTGSIQMTRAAKDLREQWNETSEYWKDKNRDDFDVKFVQPLAPQISVAAGGGQLVERKCWNEPNGNWKIAS